MTKRSPIVEAERRVVNAAMAWLRWMEQSQKAESWLREREWGDRHIPNLIRACDALRKQHKVKPRKRK